MAAHSAALISTEELARRLGAPALRIFDCSVYQTPRPEGGYTVESGRASYYKGHIPGAGFLDMPRRVSTYANHLQTINDFVSASAYCLGISMLIFIGNLVYSLVFARVPSEQNPWASRGLEWQVPTPVPLANFEEIPVITGDPYDYGVPGAPPVATLPPVGAPARAK